MKKQTEKIRAKKDPKKNGFGSTEVKKTSVGQAGKSVSSQPPTERSLRAVQRTPKKPADSGPGPIARFLGKAGQFLREAKVELKKVKWPTRKELVASTTVVIVLTLLLAFFLGLVDFGLIKIIRNVVG